MCNYVANVFVILTCLALTVSVCMAGQWLVSFGPGWVLTTSLEGLTFLGVGTVLSLAAVEVTVLCTTALTLYHINE